jgi:MFS family permease
MSSPTPPESSPPPSALDRARRRAYLRLIPLLFVCYVIAYVDRANVAIAKLTMQRDLPAFDNKVIGTGAGIFFIGYFLLEIPGTLLVEKWSARKWISRIMVSWGIVAALTAFVRTPWQFYGVRFLLGLAEAGFFPGVIVYLTHWFPSRDRARALAYFFIATPIAQIISPKLSNQLLKIGIDGNPEVLGLEGWQWVYIAWGIPAVVLGILVLIFLTDRPEQALWLTAEEREALASELKREKALRQAGRHMGVLEAFRHPKVLLLALAYFFVVTGNYGVEFFMPTILDKWYKLSLDKLTWLVILPPMGSLGRPVVRRLELRPPRRAAPARGDPDLPGRPGAGVHAAEPGPALADGRAVHPGDDGPEGVPAGLLVAAEPVPDGGGRRRQHRPDQLGGQPGRGPRPDGARHGRDDDRLLPGRHPVPLRLDGRVVGRHPRPRPRRPGPKSGARPTPWARRCTSRSSRRRDEGPSRRRVRRGPWGPDAPPAVRPSG